MNTLTLILLAFLIEPFPIQQAKAQEEVRQLEACSYQAPFGIPPLAKQSHRYICRNNYIVNYDTEAKNPALVTYVLTKDHSIGCEVRQSDFKQDLYLPPTTRAIPSDYLNSGYDIGHMANAADMAWSPLSSKESFIMSNTTPQVPGLNRGLWRSLELSIREWVFASGHDMTIYVGAVMNPSTDKKIGRGVDVPTWLYKIVIDNTTKKTQAYLFENRKYETRSISMVKTSIKNIEYISGQIIPVPQGVDKTEINPPWMYDMATTLNSEKKKECK